MCHRIGGYLSPASISISDTFAINMLTSKKMNTNTLSSNIKAHRINNGWSQELLAEKTGLNLRTIQRIESGTNPTGNTLLKLKEVLPLENKSNDKNDKKPSINLITILNLSALLYWMFPVFNIITPGIIWMANPYKTRFFNQQALGSLLIQTVWSIMLISVFFIIKYLSTLSLQANGTVSATRVFATEWTIIFWVAAMYLLNLGIIIFRTIRARNKLIKV